MLQVHPESMMEALQTLQIDEYGAAILRQLSKLGRCPNLQPDAFTILDIDLKDVKNVVVYGTGGEHLLLEHVDTEKYHNIISLIAKGSPTDDLRCLVGPPWLERLRLRSCVTSAENRSSQVQPEQATRTQKFFLWVGGWGGRRGSNRSSSSSH